MMQYRPEIDGLRAVAVIPVIFFHAGFGWATAGFIGVDVFFVISGYLITSIILSEIREGTFTVRGFYERRARRILPALYFVMILCIPFAWLLLTPSELKVFAASFASTVLFVSNFYFRKETGYFAQESETQPLLHTWSLAVEEQYYILFPLLVLLLLKRSRKWLVSLLVVMAIASLAYAEIKAAGGSGKIFYDTRGRGWALLVGSLIPLLSVERRFASINPSLREMLGMLGVLLIVAALVSFEQSMHYPGLYTLVPVAGTALIIVFSTAGTLSGKVLAIRPLVGVGLISYSAYLFHQPLFAFYRSYKGSEVHALPLVVLASLSLILAFFSWKYVEAPFRRRGKFSQKQVFMGSGAVGAGLLALGTVTYVNDGFFGLPGRGQDVMIFAKYDKRPLYREGTCFLEMEQSEHDFVEACLKANKQEKGILLWGDSHAAAAYVGIAAQYPGRVTQYTAAGCAPLLGTDVAGSPHCRTINRFVVKQIALLQPAVVVLHAYWNAGANKASVDHLEHTIRAIKQASATSRVVVIGSVPMWKPNLPAQLNRQGVGLNAPHYLQNDSLPVVREIDEELMKMSINTGSEYVSALDVFCRASSCLAVGTDGSRYEPIAWDDAHLTRVGSMILARSISDRISP